MKEKLLFYILKSVFQGVLISNIYFASFLSLMCCKLLHSMNNNVTQCKIGFMCVD